MILTKVARIAKNMESFENRFYVSCIFSEEDWLRMFQNISSELNVYGEMEVEPELVTFVKEKKAWTSLKDQLFIPELLECLEPHIKQLYDLKLDDNKSEFDYEFCTSGVDQLFYMDYFITTAMLKTYMMAHPSARISECLPELFSLGASSATEDLFPEVTVLCSLCIGDVENLTDNNVLTVNKNVLKMQYEHKFMKPKLESEKSYDFELQSNSKSDVSFNNDAVCEQFPTQFMEDIEIIDTEIFNPFAPKIEADYEDDSLIFNPFVASRDV